MWISCNISVTEFKEAYFLSGRPVRKAHNLTAISQPIV
jgi:hypothetical protein